MNLNFLSFSESKNLSHRRPVFCVLAADHTHTYGAPWRRTCCQRVQVELCTASRVQKPAAHCNQCSIEIKLHSLINSSCHPHHQTPVPILAAKAGAALAVANAAFDLAQKMYNIADAANNITIVLENRCPGHIAFISTTSPAKKPGAKAQDWEILNPYLGSAALNKLTGLWEPSTSVSLTDVVQDQEVTVSYYDLSSEGTLGGVQATATIKFSTIAGGMAAGAVSVQITNSDGKKLIDQASSYASFAGTGIDWGHGPLGFSVGWASNKYLLQITSFNLNVMF